jgi:DNA-binding transcriptional ArsR family regulator
VDAVLSVLGSPRKCEILRLVWDRERSAGDIHKAMPQVTFGAVSQQLQLLLDAGLVEARIESRSRYYRARREAFGAAAQLLENMWDDALWKLKITAELEQRRRGPKPGRKPKKSRRR